MNIDIQVIMKIWREKEIVYNDGEESYVYDGNIVFVSLADLIRKYNEFGKTDVKLFDVNKLLVLL